MGIIFSSSNGIEPLLRFRGFKGNLPQIKLSKLFHKCIQKNKDGSITNVICNSAKNGLLPQRDFFDKDIANSENTTGYYIIKNHDFVYNPRKSNEAPYGPVSTYKYAEDGIVSPLYLCFRAIAPLCTDYFEMYFKSSAWHRYIYLMGDSGARHDRVSIKDEVFFDMPVRTPSLPEQQKIADFLSLVDLRIEKQRQLVESLKKYKRGLLKSIFKGKTANRILQDCINIGKAGGTPDSANSSYYNGTIPFLSISDMTVQGKYLNSTEKQITREGLDNSSAWLVPPKSLIISMYASYGLVAINNIALSTSQAMFNIIPKNEYLYYYLTYLAFTGYYHKMVSTGTQPNLNANKIRNIPIYMPSDTEKQNITKLLTEVDNKVNAELQYLLLLIQTKKAFLQQMFI